MPSRESKARGRIGLSMPGKHQCGRSKKLLSVPKVGRPGDILPQCCESACAVSKLGEVGQSPVAGNVQ